MPDDVWLATLRNWSGPDDLVRHFADVRTYVDRVGDDHALEQATVWTSADEASTQAVGLDVLGTLLDSRPERWSYLKVPAERLIDSLDEDVRWALAEALIGVVVAWAVPLVLRLVDDPDGDVRWKALTILPSLKPVAAVEPLLEVLRRASGDRDFHLRDRAALSLAGEPRTIGARPTQQFRTRAAAYRISVVSTAHVSVGTSPGGVRYTSDSSPEAAYD